jgi:hypothetical protein
MDAHIRDGALEQLRHLVLGQPDGLILQPDLHAGAAVFDLVKDEFGA